MRHSRHGSATVMRGNVSAAHAKLDATSAALQTHQNAEFGRATGKAPRGKPQRTAAAEHSVSQSWNWVA